MCALVYRLPDFQVIVRAPRPYASQRFTSLRFNPLCVSLSNRASFHIQLLLKCLSGRIQFWFSWTQLWVQKPGPSIDLNIFNQWFRFMRKPNPVVRERGKKKHWRAQQLKSFNYRFRRSLADLMKQWKHEPNRDITAMQTTRLLAS